MDFWAISRKRTHSQSSSTNSPHHTSSNCAGSSSSGGNCNNNDGSSMCKLKYTLSSSSSPSSSSSLSSPLSMDATKISLTARVPVSSVTIAAATASAAAADITTTTAVTAPTTIATTKTIKKTMVMVKSPFTNKIVKRCVGGPVGDLNSYSIVIDPSAQPHWYRQQQQQCTLMTTTAVHSSTSSISSIATSTSSSSLCASGAKSSSPAAAISLTMTRTDTSELSQSSKISNTCNNIISSNTNDNASTSNFNTTAQSSSRDYASIQISQICSSQNVPTTTQRKRRASDCSEKDPELSFEEPSAKRRQQQCLTTTALYQSDADSIVSSVYPSPVDELVNEIDTHSPQFMLEYPTSTASSSVSGSDTESEYDLLSSGDDIPDSPSSMNEIWGLSNKKDVTCITSASNNNGNDHSDDPDGHDVDDEIDEVVSNTSSPSASSVVGSILATTQTVAACSKSAAHTITTAPPMPMEKTQQAISHQYHQSQQSHRCYGERTPAQDNAFEEQPHNSNNNRHIVKSFDVYASEYDCMTPAGIESESMRQCPLPALSWANAYDVWQVMCRNDDQAACLRDANMLKQHPSLQPRMRAILLDWLIEVCEVYKLHRETYFLAIDYLDRYLSSQKRVQKTQLQLIGITCLFVAAKVEEIYPPKIGEFAYVTDGACQESDILQYEILLLQKLDWNITPVTPMGWLGVYMQLKCNNRTPQSLNGGTRVAANETTITSTSTSAAAATAIATDDSFIFPQFSGMQFVQTAQLLDLCSLDIGFASYSYSVLAAAAISHMYSKETAVAVSGLDWQALAPCARWMKPFFDVCSEGSVYLHLLEHNEPYKTTSGLGNIKTNDLFIDDSHIIQTHTINMTMFDHACMLQEQDRVSMKIKQEASPATGLACPEGLLTPPASSRKPLGVVDDNVTTAHCSSNSSSSGSNNNHSSSSSNGTSTTANSSAVAVVACETSTKKL